MKKKHIIITSLSAVLIAGATVGAVYALDSTDSTDNAAPGAPVETAVLVKDDPSIKVEVPDTYTDGSTVFYYTEEEKADLVEGEKVRSAISAAMADDANIEEFNITDIMVLDCINMTRDQIKTYVNRLSQVNKKSGGWGSYARIRAEALGEMPVDTDRLTVEKLEELIRQSANSDELLDKISAQYGKPDYVQSYSGRYGGINQYWLDDEGTKAININVRPYLTPHCAKLDYSGEDADKEIVEMIASVDPSDYSTFEIMYTEEQLDAIFAAAK